MFILYGNTNAMTEIYIYTFNVPWFKLVEIDIANEIETDRVGSEFLSQVIVNQLFFGRMKTETRRYP